MLWDAAGCNGMQGDVQDATGCSRMLQDAAGCNGMLWDARGFPKSKGWCEPGALTCSLSHQSRPHHPGVPLALLCGCLRINHARGAPTSTRGGLSHPRAAPELPAGPWMSWKLLSPPAPSLLPVFRVSTALL